MRRRAADPLDRHRFPIDEWALVEVSPQLELDQLGQAETLFSVGNGYLGLRGNVDEGDIGYLQGTYANGFHETWPIRHAEDAYALARTGQTIVNLPDPKSLRVAVDGEEFALGTADTLSYVRRLDFRTGVLSRDVLWRTTTGMHVRMRSRRMVSFTDRHLALLDCEVTVQDADAVIVFTSELINRLALGVDDSSDADELDPRKADRLHPRTLEREFFAAGSHRVTAGYRARNSGMTVAIAMDHRIHGVPSEVERSFDPHRSTYRLRASARQGEPVSLSRLVAVHTSQVPTSALSPEADTPSDLAARAGETLDAARIHGIEPLIADQRSWLTAFWQRSDVELRRRPALQQAVRWNLFHLAQAAARADGAGVPAKGVTASGYDGHTFWDSEIFVLPFFSYTTPEVTRDALAFRYAILDRARERAREMSLRGALFPWRTINGLEASAYYPAGTAQYHIDADVARAITQYSAATADRAFFDEAGAEMLIETARMWADLGFWRAEGDDIREYHIHGVTGPDEYTTVVDDNLFTNLSARANLRAAVAAVRTLRRDDPTRFRELIARIGLKRSEPLEWQQAADGMHVPFDPVRGLHPQDSEFLEKEIWDPKEIPASKRPLLLHFHPLVIGRHQILKQADVVLAIMLYGPEFTAEQKRADFDYYDPLTTGDSSLSAVAQSVVAAEVGHSELAVRHFLHGVFVDLADLHGNTKDGVHVASAGGVWSNLVSGFGGFRDDDGTLTIDPRLPASWEGIRYRLGVRDTRVVVELRPTTITLTAETGTGADVVVRGIPVRVTRGAPVTIELEGPPPREARPERRRKPVPLPAGE